MLQLSRYGRVREPKSARRPLWLDVSLNNATANLRSRVRATERLLRVSGSVA